MASDANLILAFRSYWTSQCGRLIADGLAQVGNRLGFAVDHIAAVLAAGRHIFIDAVIALYQLGESEITQFAVCLGATDIDAGNNLADRPAAFGTLSERLVIDRLLHVKYIP